MQWAWCNCSMKSKHAHGLDLLAGRWFTICFDWMSIPRVQSPFKFLAYNYDKFLLPVEHTPLDSNKLQYRCDLPIKGSFDGDSEVTVYTQSLSLVNCLLHRPFFRQQYRGWSPGTLAEKRARTRTTMCGKRDLSEEEAKQGQQLASQHNSMNNIS